jgi:hypothetical protein
VTSAVFFFPLFLRMAIPCLDRPPQRVNSPRIVPAELIVMAAVSATNVQGLSSMCRGISKESEGPEELRSREE